MENCKFLTLSDTIIFLSKLAYKISTRLLEKKLNNILIKLIWGYFGVLCVIFLQNMIN